MPIYKNPLEHLRDLQGLDYDISELANQGQIPVIENDIYIQKEIQEKDRKIEEREDIIAENKRNGLSEEAGVMENAMFMFLCNINHVHHKAIFDSINQALDNYRPYGLDREPFPWSKRRREITFKNNKTSEINGILDQVMSEVEGWCKIFGGTLKNSELFKGSKIQIDDRILEEIREERLAFALKGEIEEKEKYFTNYEDEETQLKIDISSLITFDLISETANLLWNLEDRFK